MADVREKVGTDLMAELDTDLIDFYRTRVIERRIERDPDATAEAATEYAIWWWKDKKDELRCSKRIVWPDGQLLECGRELTHPDVCLGMGKDGHYQAFSVR